MAKSESKTGESSDLTASLRKAIVDSGLTHYAIGKAAVVAPDIILRFMNEERVVTLATASKIATALGYKLVKCDDATVLETKPLKKK